MIEEGGDEGADPLTIRPEVTDGATLWPRCTLERERDFESGERAAQPLEPIDARVTGPADGARRRRCGDPFVAELVLQQIEQLVAGSGHAANAEGHRTDREPLGQSHPEAVRLLGAQRAEAAAAA